MVINLCVSAKRKNVADSKFDAFLFARKTEKTLSVNNNNNNINNDDDNNKGHYIHNSIYVFLHAATATATVVVVAATCFVNEYENIQNKQ